MQKLTIFVFAFAAVIVGSAIEAATLPAAAVGAGAGAGAGVAEIATGTATATTTLPATYNVQQEFATSIAALERLANNNNNNYNNNNNNNYNNNADEAVTIAGSSNIDFDDGLEFSAIAPAPEYGLQPCSLSAPERNECIRDLFEAIVPKLKNDGLPELNMVSVDPYFYKRGIFRYANDGIQGGLLIKNMYIHGISQLKVSSVLSNFTEQGFIVKLGAELPQIRADGHFKADVKFGGLRLVPKGPFNITIDNIKATILTDGIIQRSEDGHQRLSLNRLNANVAIGDARIVANGIFSDRNLNAMILNLVNENLPEITRVGIPATREQWAPILVQHINEFFAEVPIEKLLLP